MEIYLPSWGVWADLAQQPTRVIPFVKAASADWKPGLKGRLLARRGPKLTTDTTLTKPDRMHFGQFATFWPRP